MKLAMFVLAGVLVVVATGEAKTIYVPDDYAKIQEAIDAAVNGDTVIVRPGTYVENIDYMGKTITIKSEKGPDLTLLNGNKNGHVVVMIKGEGLGSIIQGFTILNGKAAGGGGIYCEGSSPTILNNIVKDNVVDDSGGGILCYSCPYVYISGNVVRHNEATYGGGIRLVAVSYSEITNNTSIKNTAYGGSGGGVSVHSSTLNFINNTISGNSCTSSGGGMRCHSSAVMVKNSIFWANQTNASGKEIALFTSTGTVLTIEYCDVEGGKSSIDVGSGNTLNWGQGMIDSDPLWFDPVNNDFHLKQDPCQPGITNPCVDTGDPSSAMIDGSTRTDSSQDTGLVDMGFHYPPIKYEYLNADTYTLSEATGGTVHFTLTAGASNAKRNYILLGSLSGTEPGQGLPGGLVTLPLNWDLFTDLIIAYMNSSFFMNFLGILDPAGDGAAIFNTMGPMPPGMAGTTMSFAYALNMPWNFVSNPVGIEILP